MVTLAGGFYRINPTTCERTEPVLVPAPSGRDGVVWSADYSQFVAQTFNGWVLADINGNIIREYSDNGTVQLR
jgi:hypothetical protein